MLLITSRGGGGGGGGESRGATMKLGLSTILIIIIIIIIPSSRIWTHPPPREGSRRRNRNRNRNRFQRGSRATKPYPLTHTLGPPLLGRRGTVTVTVTVTVDRGVNTNLGEREESTMIGSFIWVVDGPGFASFTAMPVACTATLRCHKPTASVLYQA